MSSKRLAGVGVALFGVVGILSMVGCGPSREVQYLQAAEEVKAEETALAESRDLLVSNATARESIEKDSVVLLHGLTLKSKANYEKSKSQGLESFDKAQKEYLADVEKAGREIEESFQPQLKKMAEEKQRLLELIANQESRVNAARARRDALAPTQ